MGREAACTGKLDGKAREGRALLETSEVVLSGRPRVILPFAELREVAAARGKLTLATPDRTVVLDLGEDAEAWATRIRSPPTRAKKLGLKEGARVAILGVRDATIATEAEAAGATVASRLRAGADLVLLGVERKADLTRLATVRRALAPAGGIWVVFPRGLADLKDVDVMAAARAAGLVDVKVARFNETHTALKLVVPKAARSP